ncbi:MAG: hypothetical protein KDJ87_20960 [Rhizobiaceae bacterium]|nr:hypothetical protein [Rhizobiaceae bacterium]
MLAGKAPTEPAAITGNGRDRLVPVSHEDYGRLRESHRRALPAEDPTQEEPDLNAQSELPDDCAHLDERLKGCKPE